MADEFYIFRHFFHDHDPGWEPDDPLDFEVWIYVTVGDGTAGTDYQVHICTPTSIKQIRDKFGVFLIDEWNGVDELIVSMNAFIEAISKDVSQLPQHTLSRHWRWEYGYVPKANSDLHR